VSLGEEPVLMTKNAAGQLTVPLSQGEQQVLVQHRQPLRRGFGFAVGSVAVPQLSEASTQTTVTLSYPAQWVPLFEKFASRAKVWTPGPGDVLLILALALWIERLLAWLAMPAPHRFVIAVLAALAASLVNTFLALMVLACAALTIAWIMSLSMRPRIVFATLFIGATGLGLLMMMAGSRSGGYRKYDMPTSTEESANYAALPKGVPVRAAPPPPPPGSVYQGLPAKFTLPGGHHHSTFSQELLRADRPQRAFVFAVSVALTNWIGVLIALLVMVIVWRDRRELAQAIRERLARPNLNAPVTET
jgi:hypothetical protein